MRCGEILKGSEMSCDTSRAESVTSDLFLYAHALADHGCCEISVEYGDLFNASHTQMKLGVQE